MTDTADHPKVVPFVALWSDEKEEVEGRGGYFSSEEGLIDPSSQRDKRGVLWAPYGGSMSGRPLFSQVHPIRQKMCMEGPYCQVCGKSISASRTPWLVPENEDSEWSTDLASPEARPFRTHTPPTCQDCWPIAKSLCPHLRSNHFVQLIVRSYRPVGVFGDVATSATSQESGIFLSYTDPNYHSLVKFMVAKQLVVRIDRWKVIA